MKRKIPYYINLLIMYVIGYTLSKMGYGANTLYFWIIVLCATSLFLLGRAYEYNQINQ